MAIDIGGTPLDWLIWIGGGLFLVPFSTPVLTSAVAAWLLRLGIGALIWGALFGVVTVPLSWVSLRLGGWYGWSVALVISATLTVLFLWWRSRARHNA